VLHLIFAENDGAAIESHPSSVKGRRGTADSDLRPADVENPHGKFSTLIFFDLVRGLACFQKCNGRSSCWFFARQYSYLEI